MKLDQAKETVSNLLRLPGVTHGFFGMPQHWPDLDKETMFRRQCDEACTDLGLSSFTHVHQVHGKSVVHVTGVQASELAKADAMVTDKNDVALIIKTADCAPVLFADAQAGIVGAAHAGWRGALAGILPATIKAMEDLGARRENLHAAIGPAIHLPDYEVGDDFRDQFLMQAPQAAQFFSDDFGSKPHFDLPGFCAHALHSVGVSSVAVLPVNTRDEKQRFFSHRRSCQRPESRYGRNASVIALRKT